MQTISSTPQEKTWPGEMKFKQGDVVILEDIGPQDAYFKHIDELKGELFVVGDPKHYIHNRFRWGKSNTSPWGEFYAIGLSPLFPHIKQENMFFAAVKIRHF